MRLIKNIGVVMCLLAFEAQAFDAIEVDQAVRKLFQGFFADEKEPTDCDVNYSYESIRYVADIFDEKPRLKVRYLPGDVEVELEKVDFCTWSDGYWILLRYTGGEYNVIGYTSDSQPE